MSITLSPDREPPKSPDCEPQQTILQEGWKVARGLIEHEDDLVHQRINTYLTLQGFLLTVLVFGTTGLANKDNIEYRWLITLLLVFASATGFITSRLITPVINAAFRHTSATNQWWEKFQKDPEYRSKYPYPTIMGKKSKFPPIYVVAGARRLENDPYNGLGLDEKAMKQIDEPELIGTPALPGVLRRVWLILLALFFGLFLWQIYKVVGGPRWCGV